MTDNERDRMIIETHTGMLAIEKSITTLFKAVEGNGQPGLKQDMAVTKQDVAALKQLHKDCIAERRLQPSHTSNKIAFIAVLLSVFVTPVVSAIVVNLTKATSP